MNELLILKQVLQNTLADAKLANIKMTYAQAVELVIGLVDELVAECQIEKDTPALERLRKKI